MSVSVYVCVLHATFCVRFTPSLSCRNEVMRLWSSCQMLRCLCRCNACHLQVYWRVCVPLRHLLLLCEVEHDWDAADRAVLWISLCCLLCTCPHAGLRRVPELNGVCALHLQERQAGLSRAPTGSNGTRRPFARPCVQRMFKPLPLRVAQKNKKKYKSLPAVFALHLCIEVPMHFPVFAFVF